jgi:hypothetical protein
MNSSPVSLVSLLEAAEKKMMAGMQKFGKNQAVTDALAKMPR